MNGVTPEPRTPVMIVVDVSWEGQSGTLQTARARMENRSISGACIRLKPRIQVGTKLRIHWRWEEFTGVARYCRSDGREHLVGVQRFAEARAILKQAVPTNVPAREDARNEETPISASGMESLPKPAENRASEIPLAELQLDTVPILAIASSSAAMAPRRVADEGEN